MEKLIQGILHFRKHELPNRRAMFSRLAQGQAPDTFFLTCADSRVVPNLLSSSEPGDLFTVRTVGNLIAPASDDGTAIGDVSEAAAVEYALVALGVKHLVICGHSRCGAMDAVLSNAVPSGAPNLVEWLKLGTPSLDRVERAAFVARDLSPSDRLSQVNVLQQLDHLRSYRLVGQREDAGEIRLHGWWFDVATGETHIYDEERGGFVLLDDEEGERLLGGRIARPHLTLVPPPG
jgi:carbonic anhydrase